MTETKPYQAKHKIRIVTAAALFDGHDAAINIMRRVMQSSGAEIIHLGGGFAYGRPARAPGIRIPSALVNGSA